MLYGLAHLAVRHAAGAANDNRRLGCVRFEADGSTVALDGHVLIHVTAERPSASDFPDRPGFPPQTDGPLTPFNLPIADAYSVAKSIPKRTRTPILGYALLDRETANTEGGMLRFLATDLERDSIIGAAKLDSSFPDWRRLIPQDAPKATVRLDAELLGTVLKALKDFGTGSGFPTYIDIEVRESDEAVVIRCVDPNVGTLTALVMPIQPPKP